MELFPQNMFSNYKGIYGGHQKKKGIQTRSLNRNIGATMVNTMVPKISPPANVHGPLQGLPNIT